MIVIGKKASKVPKEQALDYVFGVTCGNDVSERHWQNDEQGKDVQWWRAKGADTFGPVGPYIATGLDYDNLMLHLRLNGEVKQEEQTDHLIHDIATDGQLHQPLRHAAARRPDLHRHARRDPGHQARRRGRGRAGRRRRAAQSRGGRGVAGVSDCGRAPSWPGRMPCGPPSGP